MTDISAKAKQVWDWICREFWTYRPLVALAGLTTGIVACWLFRVVKIDWALWEHAIVSLATSFAWPFAAVIICLLFREAIADLLKRLKSSKSPLGEHEFEQVSVPLIRAQMSATAAGGTAIPEHETTAEKELLDQILEDSPSGRHAIIKAWEYIERLAATAEDPTDRRGSRPYRELGKSLRQAGTLPNEQLDLLDELQRVARNLRKNESLQPTDSDVARFYELGGRMAELLSGAIGIARGRDVGEPVRERIE